MFLSTSNQNKPSFALERIAEKTDTTDCWDKKLSEHLAHANYKAILGAG